MKYIVFDLDGFEYLCTFPNDPKFTHIDYAEAVQCMKVGHPNNWNREFRFADIVSAGFVSFDGKCYGRSESLGIDSRPEDTELYKKQF